ncbi:MAG: DUF1648 domain-containing protein [Acidobacteria bacterium]|nr:DUF1648 domain-containing protein [Acidobacteriota bacterium]
MNETPAEAASGGVKLPGGRLLQLGPFAALAGAAFYLRSRWASVPERFPTHWGFDGRPNGWAIRSVPGVYGLLLIAAVLAASIALFAWLLARQPLPVHRGSAAAAAEGRFRRAVLRTLLATEYFMGAFLTWLALLPLAAATGARRGPPPIAPILALVLIFVVAITVALVRAGQEKTRLARLTGGGAQPRPGAAAIGDRSLGHWKAGIFYVNPDDPAIFVEKRFGIGYTLNFAHPVSWLVLCLAILAPLAVALWVSHAAS